MKLYRIVSEMKNGVRRYYPEKKGWFFWHKIQDQKIFDRSYVYFYTLQEVRNYIAGQIDIEIGTEAIQSQDKAYGRKFHELK